MTMKLSEIYATVVDMGLKADVRDRNEIDRILAKAKKVYDKLDKDDRQFFDVERLSNPFSDTRILAGDPGLKVGGLIAGIDMEAPEVLLADRLRERGAVIDLVFAHHPEGPALAALDGVMALQADAWARHGVPLNVGDALIGERAAEVKRRLMGLNHMRAVESAQLLGFAYMSCHTPSDNLVNRFVDEHVASAEPTTVEQLVKSLRTIPEYAEAAKRKAGPEIVAGSAERRCGKISVDMTGGTEGPVEAIERLSDAGVGTIVGMHFSEDLRKKADERKMNLVVAGHIASDAIGMNHILDALEAKGVGVTTCSGLIRVRRA